MQDKYIEQHLHVINLLRNLINYVDINITNDCLQVNWHLILMVKTSNMLIVFGNACLAPNKENHIHITEITEIIVHKICMDLA